MTFKSSIYLAHFSESKYKRSIINIRLHNKLLKYNFYQRNICYKFVSSGIHIRNMYVTLSRYLLNKK